MWSDILSPFPGFEAGIAQDTRNLILAKGEKLYNAAQKDHQLIRDHKVVLKTHTKCFSGEELVGWLMKLGEVGNADEGVILGQALLENGVIHHGE